MSSIVRESWELKCYHGPWFWFAALSQKYGKYAFASTIQSSILCSRLGPIISMNVLGTGVIVLNSAQAVNDILTKKSAITSDRPHLTMGGVLVGWGDATLFQQYGERFRQHRKFFHRQLGSRSSLTTCYPVEEEETRRFLCNVLSSPDDLAAHVHRSVGAIILKLSHGYSVKDGDDPIAEMADKAMRNFSLVSTPGGFLVDVIPVLRYLPEWFPGAGFQKDAKRWRKLVADTAAMPHEFVLEHLAKGDAVPSMTSRLLQRGVTSEEEEVIKWASFSMYLVHAFFLAMTIYPEVFKKAQAEIDAEIGADRLPNFDDRDSLPYVNAVCKELLRWNVVTPLVIHATSEDDVYEGYLIPKGSVLIGNVWQVLSNAETYPEPQVFKPERFLGDNVQPDPRNACFGWGRRICPGLHLANVTIFIAVAMSLATLDISRHVENGIEVVPKYEVIEGAVCHPKPFKCRITPRSEMAHDLLRV
ncbi:cytochrome P450 [Melanogaster broomeanus]|nr:cytochrome P450 [Melanogaster broomeanus]